MSPPPIAPEERRRRAPLRLILIVLFALVLGVLWFLSDRNHEKFFLVVEDGKVSAQQGYYFVWGAGPWAPTPAYEPFALPKGVRPEKTGAMNRKELDAVLLKLFIGAAERELSDLRKGDPNLAERMLLRANKLSSIGIGDPIERKLTLMHGDVAFRRGLTEVRGIQSRFDDALEQFRRAAMRGGTTYQNAERWVTAITELREEVRRLSEESGLDPDKVLSGMPPTPRPAPAPPPKAPPPVEAPPASPAAPAPPEAPAKPR